MVKFVPLMIGLIMTGIFAVALLTGGIMVQLQNGGSSTLQNDSSISSFYSSINNTLIANGAATSQAGESFSNSSITTTGVTPYVVSIGGIWKIIRNGPTALYNLVSGFLFAKIFGNAAAFVLTTALATILILITISAVIYWVSRGEGG